MIKGHETRTWNLKQASNCVLHARAWALEGKDEDAAHSAKLALAYLLNLPDVPVVDILIDALEHRARQANELHTNPLYETLSLRQAFVDIETRARKVQAALEEFL